MSLSKRQLGLRKDAIGGSAIACLAGLSQFASPIEIYEAMVTGSEKETNLMMLLGNALESPLADLYAEETGKWLRRVDTIRHPTMPWVIATPDRAIFPSAVPALARKKLLVREDLEGAERLLEIKTTDFRQRHLFGDEGTDQVRESDLAQVTWTLGCTGKKVADVFVLIDRAETLRYTISFNEELFAGLAEIARAFLENHVRKGIPPPPDASERYSEFLSRSHPSDNGQLIDCPTDLLEAISAYSRYKEASRRLKTMTTKAGNLIRAAIGENAGLMVGANKITWRKTRDGTKVDWEGIANEALTIAGLLLQAPSTTAEKHESLVNQLKSIVQRHTTAKPGYRVLRLAPKLNPLPDAPLALQLGPKEAKDDEAEDE